MSLIRFRTFAFGLTLSWLILLTSPVYAAATTLQTCDSSELIAAINAAQTAPGPDTIALKADCTDGNAYQLNIPIELNTTLGNSGLPTITTELTIEGNGAKIVRAAGAPLFRLFFVDTTGVLSLNNVTLSNGQTDVDSNGQGFPGGGIYVNHAQLNLNNTTVANNTTGNGKDNATGQGGNGGKGGGIYNDRGILVLNSSSVINNRAGNGGMSAGNAVAGGYAGSGGGIYDHQGIVTLDHSTLSNNVAGHGGDSPGNLPFGGYGGSGGGLYSDRGIITLDHTLVHHNVAGNGGDSQKAGGYGGGGGGIEISYGILTIRNQSEIDNNQAGAGGNSSSELGGYGGSGAGIESSYTIMTLTDSLVYNNVAGNAGFTPAAAKFMFAGSGGGIYVNYGTFTFTHLTLTGNRAGNSSIGFATQGDGGSGGGLYISGIDSGQTAKMSDSTIISNTAGVGDIGGDGGGIVVAAGALLVDHTVVQANRAGSGRLSGGSGGAFFLSFASSLSIDRSTLSANRSGDASDKDGKGGEGGAIAANGNGTLTLANTTLIGNQAGSATGANGAGGNGGAIINYIVTLLTNVTLSGNQAGHGATPGLGGSLNQSAFGTTTLYNTLLAGSAPDNCNGTIGNGSNNLDDGASCGFGALNGSLSNTNAGLDPRGLRDNGGKTPTIALLPNTPAIDAGNDTFCTGLAVNNLDQRDVTRPVGAHCDVGAFEWAQLNQSITFGPLPDKSYGDAPFTLNATASSGLAVNFSVNGACMLNGNLVTLSGVGSCTVVATQAGDVAYLPAANVIQSFGIAKANQTITFAQPSDRVLGDPAFSIAATASSGLPVSFSSNTPVTCTINGADVTLVAVGTCTITATQAGDATFNPAPAVNQSFVIKRNDISNAERKDFLPLVRR